MRFRKRSKVTDIEAARRATSGIGAYNPADELVEISQELRLYDDNGPLATVTELSASSVAERPALSVCPHVEGAGHPQFPSDVCEGCGGHVGWIDRGNHFDGRCWGECKKARTVFKPDPDDNKRRQTRDEVWHRRETHRLAQLDDNELLAHCAGLLAKSKDIIAGLQRENQRLESELNQAIAQAHNARAERDRARQERDDANARVAGMHP